MITIKSALSKVSAWDYWTSNQICLFDIIVHIEQECMGIDGSLLVSLVGLKHIAKTTQPLKYISNRNNEKYLYERFSGVSSGQKKWIIFKNSSNDYL